MRFSLFIAVLLAVLPVGATTLNQALNFFDRAVTGHDDAIDPGFEAFSTLHEEAPDDALILAYLGSLEAMRGGAAWMPWNKMKYANQGMEKLDQALVMRPMGDANAQTAPDIATAHLVAISTYLAVPGFFNRFESAVSAYHDVVDSPHFATLSPRLKAEFWERGARIALKLEEEPQALALYQQSWGALNAIRDTDDTLTLETLRTRVREALDELEGTQP